MTTCTLDIARDFPGRADRLAALCAESEKFRSLCASYRDLAAALRRIDCRADEATHVKATRMHHLHGLLRDAIFDRLG